jgi:hypothetical protein
MPDSISDNEENRKYSSLGGKVFKTLAGDSVWSSAV